MTRKMAKTATITRSSTLHSHYSLQMMFAKNLLLASKGVRVTTSKMAELRVATTTTVTATVETMVKAPAVPRVRWSDLDTQRRLAMEAVAHALSV